MKIAKLLIGIVMMFLLIPLAIAVDLPPSLTLTGDYDAVTTSAVLTAVGVDVLDNAGVAWIKLYEDGVQIAEKSCSLQKTCILVEVVVKAAPQNTYTYHAEALDKGGNVVHSNDVVIRFAGVDTIPPEYGAINAIPPSPAPYGQHSFTVEWTDNGRMGDVFMEHNFLGPFVKVPVSGHAGDLYYFNISRIELGDYQWRMTAEDVAEQGPNLNQTPWQDYTVVRADPQIVWTVAPAVPVNYGVQTSVGCALAVTPIVNDETELHLYFDGAEVSNPHVAVLPSGDNTYTCSAEQTEHYNAVSEDYDATVNKIPSQMNLFLNGAAANLANVERLFDTVTVTGNVLVGEDGLELYINGENIVNGSSPFSYSTNFNLTGSYNITLVAPETQNYTGSTATFFVNVVDTIAPDTVTGLTKENATASSITFSWTNPTNDDFDEIIIEIDGSNVIPFNITNEPVYELTGLQPNTAYNITLYTVDRDNNINSTVVDGVNSFVTSTAPDITAPEYSNLVIPANSTYDANATYTSSIDWSDDVAVDTVTFELDGVNQTVAGVNGSYEVNMTGLSAGIYNITWYANDTSSNQNDTGVHSFEIYPADSSVELLLDGAHQNITVLEGANVDINASVIVPAGGEVAIYDGATELVRGPSPQAWSTSFVPGEYNISAVYNATTNYSYSEDLLTITVEPIVRNVSISSEANKVTARDVNVSYTITITNLGNVEDNYTVSFTNDNTADVADVTPLTFTNVSPSASVQAVLTVGDNDTGDYNVTIYVESDTDASANDTVVVTTKVADFSTVINSTVAGTYYAYDTSVLISQLLAAFIQDSTVDSASYVEISTVNDSTLVNSQILDNSLIEDSTVSNSALTRCTVRNSTVNDTISSDCTIIDSYIDPSDTTGSTITGDSNIIDSNVTYSNVDNSSIETSNVNNSNVTDSLIADSSVADSNIDNSQLAHVNIANSNIADTQMASANVTNSKVDESSVQHSDVTDSDIDESDLWHAVVDNSTVTNDSLVSFSTVTDSTVSGSEILDGSVIEANSTVTDSSVTGSNITNSTVINSTIPSGTDVDDAWIEDGIVVYGFINGIYYTNTPLVDILNYAPVIESVSISPNPAKEGQVVSFSAVVSDLNVGSALDDNLTYVWDFGDGANSTSLSTTHTYSTKGTYNAGLTVTDAYGAVDFAAPIVVTVNAKGSSNGGGGRDRSSSGPRIIVLNLTEGSFVTLEVVEKDILQFEFEGVTQSISVSDITLTYVDFAIKPLDKAFTVDKYQTENLNLNGDMLNDVSVKVEEVIGNSVAKVTIGMKDRTEYDPIYIPEEQPEPEAQPEEQPEPEAELEEEEEAEELGLWQKFTAWLKGLFKGEEGAEAEPEPAEEPAESAEPTPLLGWFLAFLIVALGVAGYFVARKKVMESRLEKYLN